MNPNRYQRHSQATQYSRGNDSETYHSGTVHLNVENRNACLDAVAADENGNLINIEVQRAKRRSLSRRERYHSSLLDTNNLTSGEDFGKLPDTYVTFILEYGLKKQGLPVYRVKRTF